MFNRQCAIDSYILHIVCGVKYTQAWGAITAVDTYDSAWEEWAGKPIWMGICFQRAVGGRMTPTLNHAQLIKHQLAFFPDGCAKMRSKARG
ncbi:porin [Mesorhizobium sp. M0621]|uniref:porin n=1 Tax=Mesorhizobium sp. M0621 TaxID=2956974 RepID=UPI0033373FF2